MSSDYKEHCILHDIPTLVIHITIHIHSTSTLDIFTMPRSTKTPVKTSVKTATLHNQLSPSEVDSIVNSVMPSDAPSTPKSSPRKRKTALVMSDDDLSGVEVVDGPHPSPKKARPTTPPPGTSAFNDLPAVSFADTLAESVRSSANVKFGTTGRPSRSKTKTEKGVLLAEVKATRQTRAKARATLDLATKSPVISEKAHTPPMADVLEGALELFDTKEKKPLKGKNTSTGKATHSAKSKSAKSPGDVQDIKMASPTRTRDLRKRQIKSPEGSEDDLPEVSDLILSSPRKVELPASIAVVDEVSSMVDDEAVEAGDESICSDMRSDRYLDTDDDGSDGEDQSSDSVILEGSEKGDVEAIDTGNLSDSGTMSNDPDDVTSTVYQDLAIARLYLGLPYLDYLRPIIPYRPTTTSARFLFSKIAPTLNKSEIKNLLSALCFTHADFFVNFSRVHPDILRADNGRIRMARPDNAAAVGLYTGICTRGTVVDVDLIGPPQSQYEVHGISVAGTDQDTRRQMALMGKVLNYSEVTGNSSDLGLSFYTRGQGKGGAFSQYTSSSSMTAGHSLSSLISSVAMPGPVGSVRGGYPASRSFDQRIPVYDGREGTGRKFTFSEADFKDLSSWPLYKRGNGEVDSGTLVSVGHTVGTFKGASGSLFLSMNIQFIIVIGKPAIGLTL
ncbi:hypothetical protein BDZ94DRAFT_1315650 [Collybia nuda]|uniref:Uncharacterized protein n=1 Tax=Collybia nuda TaxID=64659 RepID=A0A9P5XSB6_9AGAR|nr:hypothetical protein BDZ94DRAFT_1315650 [Collybia nuda]